MKLRFTHGHIALLVVAIATTLAVVSSKTDAPIVDEVPHIGAGYSYVYQQDMRLNPEHPPLPKDLAGLGLLPLDLKDTVFESAQWTQEVNGQWTFGRNLIFNSGVDADKVKMAARVPMLLFFLLACWFVWKWTRERYGTTAALVALVLLAFSPTVLAHGRFVTTDMAAATGILVATYYFLRLLRGPSRLNILWAGLALGFAFLCKFNTILLAPYFIIAAFVWGWQWRWNSYKRWREGFRMVLLTVAVGTVAVVGVVWPVYAIQNFNYPVDKQAADTASIVGRPEGALKPVALWMSDKPGLRHLGHWVLGLAMVAQRSAGGNTIYYLGEVVRQGGPGYFPTVYFLKEPLAWWVLVSMALTSLVLHRRRNPVDTKKREPWWSRNAEEWIWLLWLAIYWTISVRSTLNIGVRHLLPVYPFTIMLVAGRLGILLDWLRAHDRQRLRWFSLAIAALLGWYVFETVNVHPRYLTYFNQLAGGPSGGHRFVTDSNLDWGQDIKRLAQYAEANGIRKISLDYFGWSDPSWYLKDRFVWTTGNQWRDAADFIRRNQSDGWIGVSATFFQESIHRSAPNAAYRWLLDYEPEVVIGDSIFLWRVR